jgi:zinc transporter ZupT
MSASNETINSKHNDADNRSRPDMRVGGGALTWFMSLLPLGLLALLLAVFAFTDPLSIFKSDLPAVENLSVQRVVVTSDGFRLSVLNSGPEPVTIAQVLVDDAYWQFTAEPSATIPRLGEATVTLNYLWVEGEPNAIDLVTSTGTIFGAEVPVATETPEPGLNELLAYGLLGVYVGVIPVALGLLWFPALKRLGRRGLNVILALTIGLLVFLLVDMLGEIFEVSAVIPEVYQGVPLALFAALLTWLAISAVSAIGAKRQEGDPAKKRMFVSTLIAGSIGLHNLGEGLAIGAAFALGEAALGSFLVIGFTLHNITEGVGIAAPITRDKPALWQFIGLTLLAGAPAIIGTWIGGFAYSPLLAVVFLGVGVGAIAQVIVEVGRLLFRDSEREGVPAINWANVGGLAAGIALMYFTAYFVKF